MKTQLEKLTELHNSLKRGKVKSAINMLLATGKARTGESSYRAGRGYRSVWTEEVVDVLRKHHISFEWGNEAPRGGARKLTSIARTRISTLR